MCEISSFFHPPVCFWLRNNLPAIQRCSDPRIPKHFTKITLYRKRAELCPLSQITEHIMFYNINYNVFSTHEMLTNKYLVESDVQLTPCLRPGLILDSWELLRKQPGNGAGSLSEAWLQRCFFAATPHRAVIGRGSSWSSPWWVMQPLSAKDEGLCSFSFFLVYLSSVCLLPSSHQKHETAINYTDFPWCRPLV